MIKNEHDDTEKENDSKDTDLKEGRQKKIMKIIRALAIAEKR